MYQGETIGRPRVLIAPLDWGLGHATRCIPVIHELLLADFDVIIAAGGKAETLLKEEFPDLTFLPLEGYNISYGRNKWSFTIKIIAQIPKILRTIKRENKWLDGIIKDYNISAVLSDNRYGLYNAAIFSVFITHQLCIKSTLGKWSEKILQHFNYGLINRFNQCWVPDVEAKESLAGELSHPKQKPSIPVQYIGTLSRFTDSKAAIPTKYLLILLSGPEPQRSILECRLLQQLAAYKGPVLFVRGLPDCSTILTVANAIKIKNHLPAKELEEAILQATLVISRCGYSTVMDLMALQKKSILIPTTGQTEQEYLAQHLMQNKYALCIAQDRFNLAVALQTATTFPYHSFPSDSSTLLRKAIKQLSKKMAAY